jgi:hypothetical protein
MGIHVRWIDMDFLKSATAAQGDQLLQLLRLLPESATPARVNLASRFWARLSDRSRSWSDVMRALTPEQQACILIYQ